MESPRVSLFSNEINQNYDTRLGSNMVKFPETIMNREFDPKAEIISLIPGSQRAVLSNNIVLISIFFYDYIIRANNL